MASPSFPYVGFGTKALKDMASVLTSKKTPPEALGPVTKFSHDWETSAIGIHVQTNNTEVSLHLLEREIRNDRREAQNAIIYTVNKKDFFVLADVEEDFNRLVYIQEWGRPELVLCKDVQMILEETLKQLRKNKV